MADWIDKEWDEELLIVSNSFSFTTYKFVQISGKYKRTNKSSTETSYLVVDVYVNFGILKFKNRENHC